MANMDERLEGIRFVINSKLEDVIALTQIVATEIVRAKPKNEYWHVYNYLEALLKTQQCKEAVEKKLLLESKDCGTQIQRDSCTSPKLDHELLTEEDLAAIKIQKAYRAHRRIIPDQTNEEEENGELTKEQDLTEEEMAAIKIQKAYRAHISKSVQDDWQIDDSELLSPREEDLQEKAEAAIKIQKAFRAKRSQSLQDVKENYQIEQRSLTEAELLKQEEEAAIKIQRAFRRWSRTSDQKEGTLEKIYKHELKVEVSPSKQHMKKNSSHVNLLPFISDFRERRRTVAAVESRQMTLLPATKATVRQRQSWTEGQKQLANPMSPQTLKTSWDVTKARMAHLDKSPKSRSISAPSLEKNIESQPQISETVDKNSKQNSQDFNINKFLSPKSHMSSLNSCLHANHIHGFPIIEDKAHAKQKRMKEYSKTVEAMNLKDKDEDKAKKNPETPPAPPSSPRSSKDGKE